MNRSDGETTDGIYLYLLIAFFILCRIPSFFLIHPDWTDIPTYQQLAEYTINGLIPYIDFVFEYPPLAIILFVLPGLAAKILGHFALFFRLEMLLFDLGCLILIGSLARGVLHLDQKRVLQCRLFYLILTAISFQLIYDRFDIAMAFLILLSLYLALVKRSYLAAYIALWIGAFVKIVPGLLIPLFIISEVKSDKIKKTVLQFSLSLVFFAILMLISVSIYGMWWKAILSYHGARGIHVESLYSSIVLIAHLMGNPAQITQEYGAYQIANSFTPRLIFLPTILSVVGLIGFYLLFRRLNRNIKKGRSGALMLIQASLVALFLFVILNKVLSPQFLLWLYPLAAIASFGIKDKIPYMALWVIAALLTAIIFPYNYQNFLNLQVPGIILQLCRNAILIVLLILSLLQVGKATFRHP